MPYSCRQQYKIIIIFHHKSVIIVIEAKLHQTTH